MQRCELTDRNRIESLVRGPHQLLEPVDRQARFQLMGGIGVAKTMDTAVLGDAGGLLGRKRPF